jgi:hypothetical protein
MASSRVDVIRILRGCLVFIGGFPATDKNVVPGQMPGVDDIRLAPEGAARGDRRLLERRFMYKFYHDIRFTIDNSWVEMIYIGC